jgi:hypothetical protein
MKKTKTELKSENETLHRRCFQLEREIGSLIAASQQYNEVIIELAFLVTARKNIQRAAEKVNNSWKELTLEGPVTDALRELRKTFQQPVSEQEEARQKQKERDTAFRILESVHGPKPPQG